MQDEIQNTFNANIARVYSLVALYELLLEDKSSGRVPVNVSDILRSATVFLYATLEEFVRQLTIWKFPRGDADRLNSVPIKGLTERGRPEKVLLGQLLIHDQLTVHQLIEESVREHFGNRSFSSMREIVSILTSVGFNLESARDIFPTIQQMIERRHHIVHKADRNTQTGSGQHQALSLKKTLVEEWRAAIESFQLVIMEQTE